MYRDGRGVPQDDALAYAWLSLAAGAADPALRDDRAVLARTQLIRRMSDDEIAAGQAEVQALRRRGDSAR
jgi:TPR repeat protein